MQSLVRLLTVLTLAGSLFGSSVAAFQDNLEEFIERDSAAFIVIEDPAAILAQIESSVLFENRHFQKAMEIMVDEKFPLATRERLDEMEEKWHEIRGLLSSLDEISIIIHSWPDDYQSIPKITIALTGLPEPIQSMQGILTDVKSSVLESDPETPDFFSFVFGDQISGISIQQTGRTILLSNAPEKSGELVSRINQSQDKKFKSLALNRSYMQIQKLLEKRADAPQVRGFLAPKSFRHLMTDLVGYKTILMIEPPKSIASAGFQVLLQSDAGAIETPGGTFQSALNWDFVLTYTQPSSGFGKLIESFEPIGEFPAMPFAVTSLVAVGFDLVAKRDADQEIFEKYQKKLFAPRGEEGDSGGMNFEKYFRFSEFGLFGLDDDPNLKPLLETAKGAISINHEGNPIHWKAAMEIRKVKNRESMEKLVAEKLKSENASASEEDRLVEIPNDHGRLFGRTETGTREFLKKQAKMWRDGGEEPPEGFEALDDEPLSESVLSRQYEYFVNDDWMVHCDHNSMKWFLSSVYEEPREPSTFDLLSKSTMESSGQSEFFKITYQSNKFYKLQDKRMQNSIESLRIKEKYGTGELDQSREVWERLMAEPDEFGLRNEIESTEDAAVAVQQLMMNGFHDVFGTAVSLYSRNENKMRIFGQVYSLVDE
jgi:hypothetical protein